MNLECKKIYGWSCTWLGIEIQTKGELLFLVLEKQGIDAKKVGKWRRIVSSKAKKKKEFVKLCPKTKSNFISYKKLNSICLLLLPIHFALYGPERKKREKDSDVYSCNRSFTKTHKRFTDELLRWFTLIDTTGKKREEFFNYYYRSYTVTYKELSFH